MRVREIFAIASLTLTINLTWANTTPSEGNHTVSIKESDLHKFAMIFSGGTKIPTFDVDNDDVAAAETRIEATPIIIVKQELKVHKDPTKIDTSNLIIPIFKETIVPALTLSDDFTLDSNDTNKSTTNSKVSVPTNTDSNEDNSTSDETTDETTDEVSPRPEIPTTHTEDEQTVLSDETDTEVPVTSNSVFKNPTDIRLETLEEPTFDVTDVVPELTSEEIPALELDENDWDTVTDLGYGWNSVDWFGSYFKPSNGTHINQGSWIFHPGLGWLFVSSESFDSVWIWSDTLGGWIWTSETTFGYIYLNESATWLWFDSERNLIYDFVLEKYIDISAGAQ
jgi:hypothetical protein